MQADWILNYTFGIRETCSKILVPFLTEILHKVCLAWALDPIEDQVAKP